MKSNTDDIVTTRVQSTEDLRRTLKKEKETLVSMFLANATLAELSNQFKRIDEIYAKFSSAASPE
jgi:hypothetical protein